MGIKWREWAVRLIKFSVAIGLIVFLIENKLLDLSALATLLTPGFVVVGLTLVGINLLLSCWRWQLLLKARNFPVTLAQCMSLYLIGIFFNYALPGSIGGDVVKAYYVAQEHRSRRMEAVLSVAIDRLLGLYAMVLIALMAMMFNLSIILNQADLTTVAFSTLALFGIMTMFSATAFSQRLGRCIRLEDYLKKMPLGASLARAYQAAQAYGQAKKTIALAILVSMAAQLIAVIFMIQVGEAMGEHVPLATYFFAVPIGFIVSSIPIAPAGLGVGQVAFLVLFQMYSGQKSMLGQTAITALQIALLAWGLVGAILYLRRKKPVIAESVS